MKLATKSWPSKKPPLHWLSLYWGLFSGASFLSALLVSILCFWIRSLEAQKIAAPLATSGNLISQSSNQFLSNIHTTTTPVPLTLKACCGAGPDTEQNCEDFQRPEEMFGITCCGNQVINQFEELCCENVVRRRRTPSSYVDRCCGTQTLSYDQTCCQDVVHNIPNGECCGKKAYPRNNVNVLCCGGVLNPNVEPGLVCCGTTPYDGGLRELCCGDSVFLKDSSDGCCPVYQNTTLPQAIKFQEFNSKTHQCCDVPIERKSSTKCCYLRHSDKNGQFFPKSYDSNSSCCAYPFFEITPKLSNGLCVESPPPNVQRDVVGSSSESVSLHEGIKSDSKEKENGGQGKEKNFKFSESSTVSYETSTSTPDLSS